MEEFHSDDDFKFDLDTGEQMISKPVQLKQHTTQVTIQQFALKTFNPKNTRPILLPETTFRQQSMQQKVRPVYTDRLKSPCKNYHFDVTKNFQYQKMQPTTKLYGSDRFKIKSNRFE